VFSEVMQWALMRYRVAPTETGTDRQYDAAQAHVAAEGIDCRVPHGAALEQFLAERAAAEAAAAAAAATSTTTVPPPPTDASAGTVPTDTTLTE
jgi:hypothetical protein